MVSKIHKKHNINSSIDINSVPSVLWSRLICMMMWQCTDWNLGCIYSNMTTLLPITQMHIFCHQKHHVSNSHDYKWHMNDTSPKYIKSTISTVHMTYTAFSSHTIDLCDKQTKMKLIVVSWYMTKKNVNYPFFPPKYMKSTI